MLSVWLRLGRVSNLPTVWSNALVGVVLGGAPLAGMSWWPSWLWLSLAMSLFYVGGMFLNDAFDYRIDAQERPERPIVQGAVSLRQVFIAGFALLALAVVLVVLHGFAFAGGPKPRAMSSAIALAGLIVYYDAHHKTNPLSPLIMGLCRVGVYVTCALSTAREPAVMLWWAAAGLLSYLIGLTYVAKQENLRELRNLWPLVFLFTPFVLVLTQALAESLLLVALLLLLLWVLRALLLLRARRPGNIPRAVVALIAGISLVDAAFVATTGQFLPVAICFGAFALTLLLQRRIAGT